MPKSRKRHPVETGDEARGMETPLQLDLIWKRFGQVEVDVFMSQETTYCPLWFSLKHQASEGLDAIWCRCGIGFVCKLRSATSSYGESSPAGCPFLALFTP